MMKLALIVLFAAAASALPAAVPAVPVSLRQNPFGVVGNVEDCGAADRGKLGPVSVTDCTMAPCDLVPGRDYDIDIVFTASRSATDLSLNVRALTDAGTEHLIASVPVQGSIEGGSTYTISFTLPITTQFSGRSLIIWFELIDDADDTMELCATASAKVA